MGETELLAQRFEARRRHMQAIAYRMLGSRGEVDDAVQEAWLRVARADAETVENFGGWLTTIVGRICLDMLRARQTRREKPIGTGPEAVASHEDVEQETQIEDSVGRAMLVVLDTLTPPERVALVLHDMFNVSFEDIAPIVNRSAAAARQLASRARRRVQGAPESRATDRARQREIVAAFLAASRADDFSALLAVLDPNVVLRADAAAVAFSSARASAGAPPLQPQIGGAEAVARTFRGRAQTARLALVEGDIGLVFSVDGKPTVVFDFVIENGRVAEISLIAQPSRVAALNLQEDDPETSP